MRAAAKYVADFVLGLLALTFLVAFVTVMVIAKDDGLATCRKIRFANNVCNFFAAPGR